MILKSNEEKQLQMMFEKSYDYITVKFMGLKMNVSKKSLMAAQKLSDTLLNKYKGQTDDKKSMDSR